MSQGSRNAGVVLVHPGRHPYAYEAVIGLHKAGLLRQFVAGIYYDSDVFPYFLADWLSRSLRARVIGELSKRTLPGVPADLIRSWPYAELLSRTIGQSPWILRQTGGWSGYPLVNWAADLYASRILARFKPKPAAVYGFLGAASRTFARARALGIRTILDVPIVCDAANTIRREYASIGLSELVVPDLADRVRREIHLADWVVVPSVAVADSVRRIGFAGAGIVVLPFGADTSMFRPTEPPSDLDKFRVVFAGRLEVRKGLHYLLDAWRMANVDGELVLAGGPGEQAFVARMRQQHKGTFVEAGNLGRADLAELFSRSDVFVLPSLAEGSAVATYEALAAGLPCIVTAETGSVVRDGVEGFVIPARDTQALSDRLRQLHGDRELRRRMSQAALERSREFTCQSQGA
jgi:starch synthase